MRQASLHRAIIFENLVTVTVTVTVMLTNVPSRDTERRSRSAVSLSSSLGPVSVPRMLLTARMIAPMPLYVT